MEPDHESWFAAQHSTSSVRRSRALVAAHFPRSRRVAGVATKPHGAGLEVDAQRAFHDAAHDGGRVHATSTTLALDAPQLDGPGRIPEYALNDFDVSWIRNAARMLYNRPLASLLPGPSLAANDHADTLASLSKPNDVIIGLMPWCVHAPPAWPAPPLAVASRSPRAVPAPRLWMLVRFLFS